MIVLVASFVAACGAPRDEPAAEDGHEQVADPLLQSIDKARQVEQEAIERKEELDDAMRKAEGEAGQDP